tara:strand:+ start:687 stop:905 length:219 start_codon:yes stop_codon:yes gene_type:complete
MVLPGMSDGRCFTTYISSCQLNSNMMNEKQMSNNEYRRFLQENALDLMKNTEKVCETAVMNECTYCIDIGNR